MHHVKNRTLISDRLGRGEGRDWDTPGDDPSVFWNLPFAYQTNTRQGMTRRLDDREMHAEQANVSSSLFQWTNNGYC